MFIGHFGLALGAKKVNPSVSLGMLFLAAQFIDLLWPTFLLLDAEHVEITPSSENITPLTFTHYPYSHSLVMVLVWSLLVGGLYWLISKNKKGAILVGVLVLSHWLLDLVVHVPDLPLYPGESPLYGWGLWRSMTSTVIVEGIIFLAGLMLYLSVTKAKDKTGSIGFWIMILLLVGIHIGNLLGPPPPNVTAIAWAGQLQWLFVLFGFWIDKHRTVK